MKRFYLFLVLLLIVFLAGCGAKGKTPVVSQEEVSLYAAEKLSFKDFDLDYEILSIWYDEATRYDIGYDEENQEYGLWRYDFESLSTSKTVLSAGALHFVYYLQGYVDNNGALHTLCVTVDQTGTEAEEYFLCTFDAKGSLIDQKNLTKSILPIVEQCPWVFSRTIILPKERLLFFSESGLLTRMICMTGDGTLALNEKLGQFSVVDFQLCENDRVLLMENNYSNHKTSISEIDIDTGKRKVLANSLPVNTSLHFVKSCDPEMIYYYTLDGIWKYNTKGNQLNQILSFEDSSLNGASIGGLVQQTNDDWCIYYFTPTNKEQDHASFSGEFIRLSKTESNVPTAPKAELVYAVVGPKELFMNETISFNLSQNEIKIVVKDYENIDQLFLDVIAGNIPDLVNLDNLEVYPALEKKDLLEDLSVYLQQDEDLSKEDFLPKSLEIFEANGKLYAIPYGVVLSAMMGDSLCLENKSAWNLSQFQEFLSSLPNQTMGVCGCFNQEILFELCYQYLSRFVDSSQGTCEFRAKEFLELLETAALFPDYNENDDYREKILSGEGILMLVQIGDFEDYEYQRTLFPGKGKIIGFPSSDGSGICVESGAIATAMTKNCKQKEAAWEFIKFTLTKEKNALYTSIFPSYLPTLDQVFEEAREHADSKESGTLFSYGEGEITVPPASLSEIEVLQELLYSGKAVKGGDEKIIEIICEEAQAYFAGSQSAEKVAETIQNRVSLYLSE